MSSSSDVSDGNSYLLVSGTGRPRGKAAAATDLVGAFLPRSTPTPPRAAAAEPRVGIVEPRLDAGERNAEAFVDRLTDPRLRCAVRFRHPAMVVEK
jgi:hypothetical protein